MGRKLGSVPLWGKESWVPIYLRAKFHLDPSNRLATVHQPHRQDRQTGIQDNGPIA